MTTTPAGFNWRSEEDYFLARLAVSMGILDEAAVHECLRRQALPSGTALSLSQVMVRDVQLGPEALFALKNELMRCHHRCVACGYGRYLAPGPQTRVEPCTKCGGEIHVPAAGSSMSATRIQDREQAMRMSGSFRLRKQDTDPLAQSGQGPRLFGAYVLDELLAKGGMGAVYRVRHVETGQPFALKVLLAGTKASEKQLHRFRRESKVQMELDHPNIVKIHDAGEWEGVLFYAMAMVEGTDLDAFASLERNARYGIIAKTCRALHYAHEKGYIHRDLKPANILIDKDGEPLLTDFGLTKNLEGTTQLTQEGAIMGTPFYMSPEQATGHAHTMGPASDIFSMGVLLYQMATGELPFGGESAVELYRAIVDAHPSSFAAHGIMEPQMEQVAFKAMQKEPALRYASAADLAEDIERVLRGDSPLASSVSSASKVALKVERHKRSIGFILGMVVLGLIGVVGLLVAGKVAYTKMKATQARGQRETDAKEAIFVLDQALADAESLPAREAARSLDESAQVADEILAAPGPALKAGPELRARRADVLLARARLGLRLGTGAGALRALECLDALGELDGEPKTDALAHRANACRRLGRDDEADAALDKLEDVAPADPRVSLLKAIRARLAGDHPTALALLGDSSGAEVAVERALAQAALGELKTAKAIIAAAGDDAKRSDRLHAHWGEALLEVGRLHEAALAFARALDLDPGDVDAAERLLAVSLSLGRAFEASRALAKARKKRSGVIELDVLWLRARHRVGIDPSSRLERLAEFPGAAFALADIAAARGRADPYGALVEPSLEQRATVARWKAATGDTSGLEVFEGLLSQVPRDRPPSPGLARALRDLGWAYLRAGVAGKASLAAAAALRGLPGDLDTLVLRATLDGEQRKALGDGFATEADGLGALGRGLLASRMARWFQKPSMIEPARALLQSRLVGDPSLDVVHEELARLEAFESKRPLPTFKTGLLDPALLPPLPERIKISAKDKAEAQRLANQAAGVSERRGEAPEGLRLAKQALALDPYCERARQELSDYEIYLGGRVAETRIIEATRLQLQPSWAFGYVFQFMTNWIQDSVVGRGSPRSEWETLLKKDPNVALHQVPWIMDHYLGLFYPRLKQPAFTPDADPREVAARVGTLLRLDPQLGGFLYVRAHLLALERRVAEAERDLDLVTLLVDGSFDRPEMRRPFWDWFYRAWIFADQPEAAFPYLLKVVEERLPPFNEPAAFYLGKTTVKLKRWFKMTPSLAPLKSDPRWKKEFLSRFERP